MTPNKTIQRDTQQLAVLVPRNFSQLLLSPLMWALYAKESMSSKSTMRAQISLTILTVIFMVVHYGFTADIVASFLGYLFSALALPIIIYALAFITVLKLNSNILATKQKVGLFVFPLFINLILFGTLYFMVQYGGAH